MLILFTVLGVVVGAFINQLGSDLPARRQVTRPHCPYCGTDRPWWQWISVPVYLLGRDGCLNCGARIRYRFPLVELGMAVAYDYLWITMGPSMTLVLYLVYTAILALVLVTDIERRLILNVVMYPAIVLAIVASFFTPNLRWTYALTGGAVGFTFFFLAAVVGTALFGSGALGGGDVKLAAFIGLITGFPLIIEALVLTLILGAAVSSVLLITRIRGLRDPIPYGPFLVAGAIVTLLWGYPIAAWFLY